MTSDDRFFLVQVACALDDCSRVQDDEVVSRDKAYDIPEGSSYVALSHTFCCDLAAKLRDIATRDRAIQGITIQSLDGTGHELKQSA